MVAGPKGHALVVAGVLVVAVLLGVLSLPWAWSRLFPSLLEQSRAAYARGDWPQAAALAGQVLRQNPRDRMALRVLARAAGRMGQDAESEALYQRLAAEPMAAEDYLIVAACLQRRGDFQSAFGVLQKAFQVDPRHPEVVHDLSRFLASMGRLSQAEELAHRLNDLPGQEVRSAVLLGEIHDRLSDPAGAAESLERALRLDPRLTGLSTTPAAVRTLLGRDLLKLGRPAAAAAQLQPLATGEFGREVAWLLSRAYLQEGRTNEAAAALLQAGDYGSDAPLNAEPAPYTGSARCAECHAEIDRAQQSSRHARTFLSAAELTKLPLPENRVPDPASPQSIGHRLRRDGDRVGWETRVDTDVARALILFALGSGDRGVTPVGRDGKGRLREMRLSRYSDIDGWGITTGHPTPPRPHTAVQLLGRVLNADEVRQCLGCHTTDARAARERIAPLAADRGIGCERCHGPGGNHLAAVAANFSDMAIARPRLASAEQVTKLCAECHSPLGRSVQPTDPDAVRFQGTTLPWSRCSTESSGRLSCVTCHDPHKDADTSHLAYEAKCLTCHGPATSASAAAKRSSHPVPAGMRRVACPVSPTADCIRCHMPKTSSAVAHTTFTDHHIRIHR